jgi:hypothetical protein
MQVYRFIKILPMIHQRIFKYSKSDHKIVEEKKEVYMEREMRKIISRYQGIFDNRIDT